MGYRKRGLRGSTFEEMINKSNEVYRQEGLALIQKIPTSITPVAFNGTTKQITMAYFDQESTVDYMGVVQGIPICFDAKETSLKNLPLQNIHGHQVHFMLDFEKQGGISFLLVNFTRLNDCFLLPMSILIHYWRQAQGSGRKSIPYEAFDEDLLVSWHPNYYIHYLEALQTLLSKSST